MENYCVYILANKQNTVLYTGVTNNLLRRIIEHKTKTVKGFTEKYNLNKLVWFEQTKDIKLAIHREIQIKKWRRNWKNELVEETHLHCHSLTHTVIPAEAGISKCNA